MAMNESEALGRLTHLWGAFRKTDPKMASALKLAVDTLSQPHETERLRAYLEAIRTVPAGTMATGTILECTCHGCRTRNRLAEAALAGEPAEEIDDICPSPDSPA